MQTDWDLDAAFSSSAKPYLNLNIELLPKSMSDNNSLIPVSSRSPVLITQDESRANHANSISDDWEVINSSSASSNSSSNNASSNNTSRSSSLSGNELLPLSDDVLTKLPLPKSKSTMIHKCVSVINKVLNNFSRSTSYNKFVLFQNFDNVENRDYFNHQKHYVPKFKYLKPSLKRLKDMFRKFCTNRNLYRNNFNFIISNK